MMRQDVSVLAPGLTLDADGVWHAANTSPIDYPDRDNERCFAVEDDSFWFRHRNAVIIDIVRRFPPGGFIADIGAGNGYVSLGLRQAGFDTLVVEPGPSGIRNARTRGLAPLVGATLQDAGFLPGTMPAAGLFDVLEHIHDDRGVLALLQTVVAPGGRLYLTVPAFGTLWSHDDDLAGHHRRYTLESLGARVRDAGFTPEFGTYLFWPLPLPILLFRSVPSWLGFRQTPGADRATTELQPADGVAVRALKAMLAGERALIRRGSRIPFGSSCLMVAHRA